jgi:hypothetical protein
MLQSLHLLLPQCQLHAALVQLLLKLGCLSLVPLCLLHHLHHQVFVNLGLLPLHIGGKGKRWMSAWYHRQRSDLDVTATC